MWAFCSGSSDLYIWNTKDLSSTPQKIHLQDCSEITCMIRVKNQVRDMLTVFASCGFLYWSFVCLQLSLSLGVCTSKVCSVNSSLKSEMLKTAQHKWLLQVYPKMRGKPSPSSVIKCVVTCISHWHFQGAVQTGSLGPLIFYLRASQTKPWKKVTRQMPINWPVFVDDLFLDELPHS